MEFIGIEGGGTKFVCVYGNGFDSLKDRVVIQTQSPNQTVNELVEYIDAVKSKTDVKAIGLAVFGPLDLDRDSPTYGYITTTPKQGWNNFDIVGALKQRVGLPIGFNTDVNGAALGEYRWGAAQSVSDFLYLTVGTGIGGGAMVNGKLLQGAMHPEMGHMLIPHENEVGVFDGACNYHKNCLESLASGPAIQMRWKINDLSELPESHSAWNLQADYLGIGLANYIATFSPKRIILGGGVMQQEHLFPKVRKAVLKYLNGYLKFNKIIHNMDDYIVKPGLGNNSGVCGAIALAEQAFQNVNY